MRGITGLSTQPMQRWPFLFANSAYLYAMLRALALCVPIGLAAPLVTAEEMTLIVERDDSSVAIYFGLPATGMLDVFALPPGALTNEGGQVPFEELRLGTWEIGDALFAPVAASVGGAPAVFEAMSLMVHPTDQRLPLRDPLDGMLAIAVCSVEPPEAPTLDTLYSYVGLIAYPDDPAAPIGFELPATGRAALEVTVRDFYDGRLWSEANLTVEDGGTLSLGAVTPRANVAAIGGLAFFGLLTLAGLGYGVYRRGLASA